GRGGGGPAPTPKDRDYQWVCPFPRATPPFLGGLGRGKISSFPPKVHFRKPPRIFFATFFWRITARARVCRYRRAKIGDSDAKSTRLHQDLCCCRHGGRVALGPFAP